MRLSIGACLYGFAVGGTIFLIELLAIGVFHLLNQEPAVDLLEVVPYCIVCAIGVFFLLTAIFWLACFLVVFPASFLSRAFPIPSALAACIGGVIAGGLCWAAMKSPGVGSNMEWSLYLACISSSLITGSVTGFMLARLHAADTKPAFPDRIR
jgi:hypothetical protein